MRGVVRVMSGVTPAGTGGSAKSVWAAGTAGHRGDWREEQMSTKRKHQRPLRNLQVLMARAAAEVRVGMNIAHVEHDDWCPALKSYSMLDCCCAPLIEVEHVG